MTEPIRLLDLQEVSPLRSQAIYHGLAEAMTEDSQDTVVLLRSKCPYFSVGFHQKPAEELDLPWCQKEGYPVLHRRIGGGTVYVDRNQLLYQVIIHRSRVPLKVEAIYRMFLKAPLDTLRLMGLDAALRDVNELEVRGKRIAGTGGGQLGEAMVVTGNILFDFNYDAMARAWRVPSEAFRRMAAEGLIRYVTTLKRELSQLPAMEEVKHLLVEQYMASLGRPLVPGSLSLDEEEAIALAGPELAALSWPDEEVMQPERRLKLASGVSVWERRLSASSGFLRLTLRLRDGVIDDLALGGVDPSWSRVAQGLKGRKLKERLLLKFLEGFGEKALSLGEG